MDAPCYTVRANLKVIGNETEKILFMQRCQGNYANVIVANLNHNEQNCTFPFGNGKYKKVLDSAATAWGGSGVVLPDEITEGDRQSIRGFNFAVFEHR